MSELQSFDALIVASAITGFTLKDGMAISDVHKLMEWAAGHPVWTHELVHAPTRDPIVASLIEQFPNMPTREEAEADWRAAADKVTELYGRDVAVARASLVRAADPISTCVDVLRSREGRTDA